jgi:hypothetical protein
MLSILSILLSFPSFPPCATLATPVAAASCDLGPGIRTNREYAAAPPYLLKREK